MKIMQGFHRLLFTVLLTAFVLCGTSALVLADDGYFTPTGGMSIPRAGHNAILLKNGLVLIASGEGVDPVPTSAELYNPATGTFATVSGNLNYARFGKMNTLLQNGKVLFAGGIYGGGTAIETFDPETNNFSIIGNLNVSRSWNTVTLLNNGKVLVVGGRDPGNTTLNSAEIIDPETGISTPAGNMNSARYSHTATLLNDGKVLIAGGSDEASNTLGTAELFDPSTGLFTLTQPMVYKKAWHTATLLLDGRVLMASGQNQVNGPEVSEAEVFDPATGSFSAVGSMLEARAAAATLLKDGRVLFTGGVYVNQTWTYYKSAEIFNPATNTFTSAGNMTVARYTHYSVLLPNGNVLLVGGRDHNYVSAEDTGYIKSAELYIPTAAAQLPKTGQTTCYDAGGAVISCAGTVQDGELQAGIAWPNPRFTDNGNQTVTDNMSGLVWSKDANPAGATKTWQESLDYIKTLNSSNYLGYSDWRLPNRNELASLVDLSRSNPALPSVHPFANVIVSSYYWSSSTDANNASNAWLVYIYNGFVNPNDKTLYHYVWPVRGGQSGNLGSLIIYKTGQSNCYDAAGTVIACAGTGQDGELQAGAAWPTPRFTDNDNQTVTDNMTGLVWGKDANPAGATKTWQDALDYIKTLNSQNYLSYNDWRLPNKNELASLVDISLVNPALPSGQQFANVQSSYYWSSSTDVVSTDYAWIVTMHYGDVYNDVKTRNYYVWPVRGGQSGSSVSLVLSKSGTGTGTITSNPSGINCGAVCSASFATETNVTLTATPNENSVFLGWGGACAGNSTTCSLTMDAAKAVSALFGLKTKNYVRLFIESNSPATFPQVSKMVELSNITDQLEISRQAALLALASDGWNWEGSGGSLGLRAPPDWTANLYWINIPDSENVMTNNFGYALNDEALQFGPVREMNFHTDELSQRAPHDICETANNFGIITGAMGGGFSQCAVQNWGRFWIEPVYLTDNLLTVNKAGTGAGNVAPSSGTLAWTDNTGTASYAAGASVTLTATADSGSTFTGWSGACTNATGTCALTMDAAKNVTANFALTDATPTITSATSSTANGTYLAGANINITLNFSEAVSSTGLTITLNTGAVLTTGALGNVTSWSGTYAVVSGQTTADLTIISVTGTITDGSSNNTANPAIPAGQNIGDGKAIVIALNGVCGSSNGGAFSTAPATNLCNDGNATSVTGSGPWNWTCAGLNGGSTANCSASAITVSKPTVSTTAAVDVASFTATLAGVINPNSGQTTYYFTYGTETVDDLQTEPAVLAAGSTAQSVQIAVSSLQSNTTYYYRLVATNSAGTSYGAERTLKTLPAVNTRRLKAIIVAGGSPSSTNTIWKATKKAANNAYNTLMAQGIDKTRIRYLSQSLYDADGDGTTDVYELATAANLENEVTNWAATDTDDVLLYLVDHGGDGYFVIREGETVSASNLKTWLDSLQQFISGRVIVIYDACYAGSFVPILNPPPANKERIVIASTSASARSAFLTEGTLSFSNLFWNELSKGYKFYEAYLSAKKSMGNVYSPQVAQLDVNGNGTGNEKGDGELALSIQIGNEIGFGALPPSIGSVSPEQAISGTSATIYADNVTGEVDIQKVWAVITPPNYTGGGTGEAVTDDDLPTVDLINTGGNRWEVTTSNFTEKGLYTITIFAMDSTFLVSQPLSTTVNTSSGSLYANFTNAGIWKYSGTGTDWTQTTTSNPQLLVTVGSDLYGTFEGLGIWKFNGTDWTQTTTSVPQMIVGSSTTLYGTFSGLGIWEWNGSAWSQTTTSNPQKIVASTSDLYGTFASLGIWKWNGTEWSQLTTSIPDLLVTSGEKLYGTFAGLGIWLWNGTQWVQATPNTPQMIAANSTTLYGTFEGQGIWSWDGVSTWTQISTENPTQMVAAGTDLYAAFNGNGIRKWDGTAWTQIATNNPVRMVVGK